MSIALIVVTALIPISIAGVRVLLNADMTQIVCISSRPKAHDFYYIAASQIKSRFLYLRSDEPFARSALRQTNTEIGNSSIVFLEARKFMVKEKLENSRGHELVVRFFILETISQELPVITVAALLGLVVAQVIRFTAGSVILAFLVTACIALVKQFSACAACPKQFLLGIEVTTFGFVVLSFAGAAIFASGWFSAAKMHLRLLAVAIAIATITWQVSTSIISPTTCVPCQAIAFLVAWIVGCSSVWIHSSETLTVNKTATALQAFVLISTVWVANAQSSRVAIDQVKPLTAFGKPKQWTPNTISELGLKSSGKSGAVYVGTADCQACELAVEFLTAGKFNITYTFVGEIDPDGKRNWIRLPATASPSSTPTMLFFDENGDIMKSIIGFSQSESFLKTYVAIIDEYTNGGLIRLNALNQFFLCVPLL